MTPVSNPRDTLFADPLAEIGLFTFDDSVARVFPDMIKRANGYSELEVAGKRSALENVLLPETLNQHKQRIDAAGFSSCDVWFQCFNFASLVALK